MMTFALNDGRILRCRQRKLLGPVRVDVLSDEMGSSGCREVLRSFDVPTRDFVEFLAAKLEQKNGGPEE